MHQSEELEIIFFSNIARSILSVRVHPVVRALKTLVAAGTDGYITDGAVVQYRAFQEQVHRTVPYHSLMQSVDCVGSHCEPKSPLSMLLLSSL